MRKSQIISTQDTIPASDEARLDVDRNASVEVTSEEEDGYPIECALLGEEKRGWRAADDPGPHDPGPQIIRLVFDNPQTLRHIQIVFEDKENTRTQEFVLPWSGGRDDSFREIVRQQWNFSPPDSTREIENYSVELREVAVLDLIIEPDQSNGNARASLLSLRLG